MYRSLRQLVPLGRKGGSFIQNMYTVSSLLLKRSTVNEIVFGQHRNIHLQGILIKGPLNVILTLYKTNTSIVTSIKLRFSSFHYLHGENHGMAGEPVHLEIKEGKRNPPIQALLFQMT